MSGSEAFCSCFSELAVSRRQFQSLKPQAVHFSAIFGDTSFGELGTRCDFAKRWRSRSTGRHSQLHQTSVTEPKQLLKRIGAAQLHIDPTHTHTHLRCELQQLQTHAPNGRPRPSLRLCQSLGALCSKYVGSGRGTPKTPGLGWPRSDIVGRAQRPRQALILLSAPGSCSIPGNNTLGAEPHTKP